MAGRGSVIGLQSPGYQLVVDKLRGYRALLPLVPTERTVEAQEILEQAQGDLEVRILRVVPMPRYDGTWAAIMRFRLLLCESLPLIHIGTHVLPDVVGEIDYLSPGRAQTDAHRAARLIAAELLALRLGQPAQAPPAVSAATATATGGVSHWTAPPPDADPVMREANLRSQLAALSREVADARQAMWLKVNMRRNRLAIMGPLLILPLVAVIVTLPHLPDGRNWIDYLTIELVAATGGLISALLGPETLRARATAYYIRRRLLYLRPLIGAALGLVSVLAVAYRLVSIAGIDAATPLPGLLVVGFAAGFAERAFVGSLIGSASPDADKPAAHPRAAPVTHHAGTGGGDGHDPVTPGSEGQQLPV